MSDPGPPEYNVYRAGRSLRDRLRPSGNEPGGLRELRKLREGRDDHPPGEAGAGGRSFPWRRVVKIVLAVCVAWVLLSVILFFVSAQTDDGEPQRVKSALDGGGSLFTGSTILVLGSDARPKGSKEPGAGGPSRSDSIMLMHTGFATVRKLSIPRDSLLADGQKINAAYAQGGPAGAIRTVRSFMGHGLKINHVIEVNFTEFPQLIDSLGGIDVSLKRCIASPPFGGRPFKLRAGEHHLNGRQALAFARVRKNKCSPAEDDRDRAKRQQLVLSEIRSKALSPATFLRLPWVAWQAPRTIRTDLRGLGLSGLFTDLLTGGAGNTHVLKGTPQGNGIFVSEDDKAAGVRLLEGK